MQFSILNRTKRPTPRIPFEKIKDDVLGKRYELSLVLCGSTLSRRLNRAYRGKDKPANVLSFPLDGSSGEIFIDLSRAKRFSPGFLFIHGLLHLKGMEHGATMERMEEKLLKRFQLSHNGATNKSGS